MTILLVPVLMWCLAVSASVKGFLTLSFCVADTTPTIKVLDKVRVKQSVATPTYKWGSVTHGSIGTVTGE